MSGRTAIHRKKISPSVEFISRFFDKNTEILDYGCGFGKNSEELRNKGFKVYGYDIFNAIGETVEDGFDKSSNYLPPNLKFDYSFSSFVLNVVNGIEEENIITKLLLNRTEKEIYHIVRNKELISYNFKKYQKDIKDIIKDKPTSKNIKDIVIGLIEGFETSRGYQRLVILPDYELIKNSYGYKIYKINAKNKFEENSIERIVETKEFKEYEKYVKKLLDNIINL